MKLFGLIAAAFGRTASAVMPWPVSERDSSTMETTSSQDVPAVDPIPGSGGPEVLLSTVSLLLGAGILAYSALRRWGRA